LLLIETLPDALPAAVGANCALKVLDCPGGQGEWEGQPAHAETRPVTPALRNI